MIGALIQARLGSKRLPNKVLKRVNKRILLEIMMSRLSQSKKLEKIIICTTTNKEDDKIVQFCKKNNFLFYRGSSRDVMSRFLKAANKFNISIIVRLTADCPLIDPKIVDKLIDSFKKSKVDYLANTCPPENSTYPDGCDVEVFKLKTLEKISLYEKRKEFREHVTYNFWQEIKYKSKLYKNKTNLSNFRYTLDYKEDLILIKKIVDKFKSKIDHISMEEITHFLKNNKNIYLINDKCKNLSISWKKI